MSDNTFVLAADGWTQVTPCGEFPHVGAGVTQVIDREACDRIAADFKGRKSDANFPGVLVDFDHFSLDTEKSSEAAGWISDLESRDTGLWARVRWSDAGLSAVRGGRFRLMSPVFPPPSACEDLGGGKIRPVMLVSVALTNEPNIRGGRPIANRKTEVGGQRSEDSGEASDGATTNGGISRGGAETLRDATAVANRGGTAKKYRWVLGNPPSGKHCGTCLAREGQIKTAREWAAMGAPPCNCHCSLEEVDEETANRWSDMARAASLAVRRAKAERRRKAEGGRMKDEAVPRDGNAEAREAQRLERSAGVREGGSASVGDEGAGKIERRGAETQRLGRSALVREGDSALVEGQGEVSRGDAETQRNEAARAAVMRELAEKRSTFNAQRVTPK